MVVPQRIRKIANVASQAPEKIIGNVANSAVDAKNFVFSMGRRRVTTVSTNSSKSNSTTSTTTTTKSEIIIQPSKETSLIANTLLWAHFIPPMPVIASTMYRHYAKGPLAKSWSLSTDITIAVIRDFLDRSSKITVEDIQRLSTTKKLPIPSNIKRRKFTVPNEYRKRAGDNLVKLFTKKDEQSIGWDWEKDRDTCLPMKGEWLQSKGNPLDPCKESTILYLHGGAYYLGSYGIYRQFLSRLIKYSKGRTVAVDYRLAPQHPFPAAVEDALATYLYLIDPPKDDESYPIDPKKIVIAGDSAGGGLTFSLLMAIRDVGLPAPGGAMTLSPWMDLTHSLPSILSNIMTDYLPPVGFKHAPSPALDYAQLPQKEQDTKLLEKLKDEAEAATHIAGNKTIHHENEEIQANRSSIGPFGEAVPVQDGSSDLYRVQFYADNDALKIPMVSPIFDRKYLRGLPRLLIQCGTSERLRDESIYAALAASNTFPGANEKSLKRGEPTNVTLEMYTDQPHVFQLLFSNKSTSRAMKSLAAFVRDVTNSPASINNQKKKEEDKMNDKQIQSYVTDDIITIRNISPQGKITDTTKEMLDQFSREEWNDWVKRLERSSMKERMDDVTGAYKRLIKDNVASDEVVVPKNTKDNHK